MPNASDFGFSIEGQLPAPTKPAKLHPLAQTISDEEHAKLFPNRRYISSMHEDAGKERVNHLTRRQEAMDAARALSRMYENAATIVAVYDDGEPVGVIFFRNNVMSITTGDCR